MTEEGGWGVGGWGWGGLNLRAGIGAGRMMATTGGAFALQQARQARKGQSYSRVTVPAKESGASDPEAPCLGPWAAAVPSSWYPSRREQPGPCPSVVPASGVLAPPCGPARGREGRGGQESEVTVVGGGSGPQTYLGTTLAYVTQPFRIKVALFL